MRAGCRNPALLHKHNHISIDNGRQAMGDHKAGSPLHKPVKPGLNCLFMHAVQRTCRLIQKQNIGIA